MWKKIKETCGWFLSALGVIFGVIILGQKGVKEDVKKKINKSVSNAVNRNESSRAKRIKNPLRKNNK